MSPTPNNEVGGPIIAGRLAKIAQLVKGDYTEIPDQKRFQFFHYEWVVGDAAPDFYADHVIENREKFSEAESYTAQAFLNDPVIN